MTERSGTTHQAEAKEAKRKAKQQAKRERKAQKALRAGRATSNPREIEFLRVFRQLDPAEREAVVAAFRGTPSLADFAERLARAGLTLMDAEEARNAVPST